MNAFSVSKIFFRERFFLGIVFLIFQNESD